MLAVRQQHQRLFTIKAALSIPGVGQEGVRVLNDSPLHWAPKVRQDKIRRLYAQDACGLLDETLLDVVAFLDQLSYGAASTPEVRDTHATWQATMQQMRRFRRSKPKDRGK